MRIPELVALRPLLLAVAFAMALTTSLPASAAAPARLDEAERLLDQERPEEALEILDGLLSKGRPSARALLLRSTGRIMMGDVRSGYDDLRRALEIDPALRQGWLNLAGLEIAEGRFDAAYEALVKARDLDPDAPDNDLNLGAVLALQGELARARDHFDRYLRKEERSAEAHYLVATNYALAGEVALAVLQLRRAFEIDERLRLRARSDDRFLALADPAFEELLRTDVYTPPPGAHTRAAAFRVPYETESYRLLYALLDALDSLEVPYDPSVETTAGWALVWTEDMRIKVHNQAGGTGVVSLSAPADRFTDAAWDRRAQELFRALYRVLGE